jgi:hypothetical protein
MQEWIEKLADKSTEGMLTPERDEYKALVRVGKFVAILRRRNNSENLAFACYHCNLHKGPNLSGIDQESGALVRLFNPREPL